MQKQAPTIGRLLVMVGFALSCFGLLLFLLLAFGGPTPFKPQGYRVHVAFAEATQLAKEADVRISGVSVGRVKTIEPDKKTGESDVVIELRPSYAPMRKDARAILRQKTLLGETYVELTPGTPGSDTIPEGGALARGQVSPTVELDEILRAFDPKTQAAFRNWLQTLAVSVDGRGRDINEALGHLGPLAQDADTLLRILNAQEPGVRRLVRNTGTVFEALTERDAQLRSLIENADRVFATTASRDRELAEAVVALPTFESEATKTVDQLARFSVNANPLITQLRPAARELSPTLKDLDELAPDLKALFRDLNPLIRASRKGLPATERFLGELQPLLAELDSPLRQLNPVLSYIGMFPRELGSFFANTVASTQASNIPPGGDPNNPVHYLRTTNPLNPENVAAYPFRIGTNRPNAYALPGHFDSLKTGLLSYETRHCEHGVPTPADSVLALLPQALADGIREFVYGITGSGAVAAPPCKKQGKYNVGGATTDYPHVTAGSGTAARSSRP